MAILRDAIGFSAVLPSWSHFALFVGHYMRGDIAEARYHASQLTSETYVYGQLARALITHIDGDAAETRRAVQAILSLQPAWGEDPRREIGKLVTCVRDRGPPGRRSCGNRLPVRPEFHCALTFKWSSGAIAKV